MQVQLRRLGLGDPQAALVVLEAPVGVNPRLHADLGGTVLYGLADAAAELLAVLLVGVGREPGALARLGDGARHGVEANPTRRLGTARPAPRDERPVARLDDIEHAL